MNSIISTNQADTLAALQKSRLSALIEDKGLLNRICEAAVALLTNDKLRACDEGSILGALYKAANLGCRLEPEFGECYLIPRNVKAGDKWVSVCCFQLGYKFWKNKALESGHISFLEAREVYAEDKFEFEQGTSAFIKHIPAEQNKGITTYFYARAKLKDGNEIFEVINKQAAEKSRRSSETQYDGKGQDKVFSQAPKDIWAKHYAPMALRRPIKLLCSMLPLTPAIEAATQADGTVTYVQKDGQVVTMSPVEVENSAAQPQDTAAEINPELAEMYLKVKDILDSMTKQAEVLPYWNGFKKGELANSMPFLKMFFEKMATVCTTVEELKEFWASIGKLTEKPELVKIITVAKSNLENAKS